jgi:Protein of unknown function (DUF2795)
LPRLAGGNETAQSRFPKEEIQMQTSPTDVQKAIKGADYPASREDLIDLAQDNDAPEEVIEELEDGLQRDEYDSPAQVMADLSDYED